MDFDFDDIAERADNLRSARKVEPQPQLHSNIAWIDTETSGLDERDDVLLEIACIVTDSELNELGTFHEVAYYNEAGVACLKRWARPVVVEMHEKTGLWDRLTDGTFLDNIDRDLMLFLEQFGTKGTMPIAGNSVAFDARFMREYLPNAFGYLDYRMIDVSTLRLLKDRWFPETPKLEKHSDHTALKDIQESIRELKHYREVMFK